jgi:hypothetical protein
MFNALVSIGALVYEVLDLRDNRVVALSQPLLESEVPLEGRITDAAHLKYINYGNC